MGLLISSNTMFKKYITGYMLVILVDMTYTVSVISAQLSMADTALFEPNCIRFVISTTISVCLLVYFKQSFKVELQHIYLIILIGVCDYIYSTCYYVSAVFMPVGNLEGMYVAVWIISSTVVDLLREKVKPRSIASAVLASVGIFLMVQPWKSHNYVVDVRNKAPCDIITWEHVTTNNTYPGVEQSILELNYSSQDEMESNETHSHHQLPPSSNYTYNGQSAKGLYTDIETSSHAVAYGYLLITVAAICATATSNLAQSLMTSYSVATLTFWIGLFEGTVSVILTFAFDKYPGFGGWSLPTAKYCLIFTLIYIVFAAVMDLSSYYTYKFLPVSQVVILLSLTIMMLYMCQRTFLFNDGNANVYEVCGVLCTFFGAALSPISTLCQRKSKYEEIT